MALRNTWHYVINARIPTVEPSSCMWLVLHQVSLPEHDANSLNVSHDIDVWSFPLRQYLYLLFFHIGSSDCRLFSFSPECICISLFSINFPLCIDVYYLQCIYILYLLDSIHSFLLLLDSLVPSFFLVDYYLVSR